jgi:cytoskeletal protein CcmA (bactofilin family)
VVFRKDTKVDAFQRQISALRQQLGPDADPAALAPATRQPEPERGGYDGYGSREARLAPAPAYPAPVEDDFGPIDADDPIPFPPTLDARTSVVAHDTTWKGDLQSDGSVHVHGKVEGSLTARADVFVAEEATVEATIAAENVSVAGNVRGTIRCSGRFEVLPQGRVSGEVFAPVLVVHEGATVNASVSMTAAEAPASIRRRLARSGS